MKNLSYHQESERVCGYFWQLQCKSRILGEMFGLAVNSIHIDCIRVVLSIRQDAVLKLGSAFRTV